MKTKIRLSEMFDALDAKDPVEFASHFTDDALFRFGGGDPVRGRESIRESIARFFGTVGGIRHHLIETWERNDSFVCQGELTCTRLDGTEVTLPFATVFRIEFERTREFLIHIDPTPLA